MKGTSMEYNFLLLDKADVKHSAAIKKYAHSRKPFYSQLQILHIYIRRELAMYFKGKHNIIKKA